jgi:hypothetical protein
VAPRLQHPYLIRISEPTVARRLHETNAANNANGIGIWAPVSLYQIARARERLSTSTLILTRSNAHSCLGRHILPINVSFEPSLDA